MDKKIHFNFELNIQLKFRVHRVRIASSEFSLGLREILLQEIQGVKSKSLLGREYPDESGSVCKTRHGDNEEVRIARCFLGVYSRNLSRNAPQLFGSNRGPLIRAEVLERGVSFSRRGTFRRGTLSSPIDYLRIYMYIKHHSFREIVQTA